MNKTKRKCDIFGIVTKKSEKAYKNYCKNNEKAIG